jgi:hydrogenase expression/formation protein HypD
LKYVDEYRDGDIARGLVREIARIQTQPWVIMEVCGGQTHSIVKHGIDFLLPQGIELVHGPGCPVCVTSLELIDKAHALARRSEVIFCSFGDMLRVPGSESDLFALRSQGADVRVVYSPLDCLKIARANPARKVVFFAIGFETTAPANAMLVWRAREEGLSNIFVLVSHVLVPPAMAAILGSPDNRVRAFLGPGHVCAVEGFEEYQELTARFKVPIVITGFEPLDILEGVLMAVRQLESGGARLENQYVRAVTRGGNRAAQEVVKRVFQVCDRRWRGVGSIPQSGYMLREEFTEHDAERVFGLQHIDTKESAMCISGEILRGVRKPPDCSAFARLCTPQHPLGATMVSAEGACAAYYLYGRHTNKEQIASAKQSVEA